MNQIGIKAVEKVLVPNFPEVDFHKWWRSEFAQNCPQRCAWVPIWAGLSAGAKPSSHVDNFQVTSVNILQIINFRTPKNCR